MYEEMYTRLSAAWVSGGYITHMISTFVNDREGLEGWRWLGFGAVAKDAVRALGPMQGRGAQVNIRRATLKDMDELRPLHEALFEHLAGAPTFLPDSAVRGADHCRRWLANPEAAVWLGGIGNGPVAFLGAQPCQRRCTHCCL